MTDRLRSCKDSPDGKHSSDSVHAYICRYCFRSMSCLMDQGEHCLCHEPSCVRNEHGIWARPNDTAAEQLARKGKWNSIEDGTE